MENLKSIGICDSQPEFNVTDGGKLTVEEGGIARPGEEDSMAIP